MRLIKIDGELNGYKFTVKPESLSALKADKELKQDMKEWQEKNNKEFVDYMNKYEKQIASNDFESIPDIPESKDWREDASFRAKRFKKMADYALNFNEQPPESLWKSEDIEYGVLNEAWDFFMGKRQTPMNISSR